MPRAPPRLRLSYEALVIAFMLLTAASDLAVEAARSRRIVVRAAATSDGPHDGQGELAGFTAVRNLAEARQKSVLDSFFDAAAHRASRLQSRSFRAAAVPAPPGTDCLSQYRNASNNYQDPCTLPGRHGRCVNQACQCDYDEVQGHWVGQWCDSCARGWAGTFCLQECQGGSCNRCSSHGTCNEGTRGDGSCTCYSTRATGFWGGSNCSECAANYFGATCERACPGLELTGAACFGRGLCETGVGGGTCKCNDGYGSDSGCFECDHAHWGQGCTLKCDGYVTETGDPCSGHGRCISGTSGNGKCICEKTWGLFDCSTQCPGYSNETMSACNHGTCLDGASGSATCECAPNFAPPDCGECIANVTGPDCDLPCPLPPAGGGVCDKNGVCTVFNASGTLEPMCDCVPGYYQRACNIPCPGNPPCSGHGSCIATSRVECQCNTGFTGETCDQCAADYAGSTCSIPCPKSDSGLVCNDLGTCWDGKCFCREQRNSGFFFCGDACELPVNYDANSNPLCATNKTLSQKCSFSGRFGPACQFTCPGTNGVTVCSGHGVCDDGIGASATGRCTCFNGYGRDDCSEACPATSLGACSGVGRGVCGTRADTNTAVCVCKPGFSGDDCAQTCPVVAGAVCAGHGTCKLFDGSTSCECDAGFTGVDCDVPCACNSDFGRCNATLCADLMSWETCTACDCSEGFDALCDSCVPGRQGDRCESVCSEHGASVGRECVCEQYWSGSACDVPCQEFNGTRCGGRGVCIWGNRQTGACDCNATFYGVGCSKQCTVNGCKTNRSNPLMHPQCNPDTGDCECQDDIMGHWSGPTCSVCHPSYWGPVCTEECQCNGNGICDQNTGECSCYDSDDLGHYAGTFCESCASGYIGQRCTRQNVAITRVFREAGQPLDANKLHPTVLTVSDDGTSIYAGSTTVYLYRSSDLNLTVEKTFTRGSYGCGQEVTRVYIGDDAVYFVLQPDTCGNPARLARWPKSAADAPNASSVIGLSELETTSLHRSTIVAETARIIGIDSVTVSGFPMLLFVLADTFLASGDPIGGVLLRVTTATAFPTFQTSSVAVDVLSSDFVVLDLSAGVKAASGIDQIPEVRIALVGKRVAGDGTSSWHGRFYKNTDTGLSSLISSDDVTNFESSMVDCWPTPATAGGTIVSRACDGCVAADRVVWFEGESVVISVYTETTVNQTLFVNLRPWGTVQNGERLWVTFAGGDGRCELAEYQGSTGNLVSVTNPSRLAIVPLVFVATTLSDALDSRTTAFSVDPPSSSVYAGVAATNAASPSRLTKLRISLNEFEISGSKTLNFVATGAAGNVTVPEVLTSLGTASRSRQLFGLIGGIGSVRLASFLMYEVTGVSPDIADRRPGTVLTIFGSGFTPGPEDAPDPSAVSMCRVGAFRPTEATNVTFNSLNCIAPDAQASSSAVACVGERVAVSLLGSTSEWFTENVVRVKRYEAPRVTGASPARGGRDGGTVVTITGSGLVESSYATCTFFSGDERGFEIVTSQFVSTNNNEGTCVQPASINASVPPSFINISLDGQLPAAVGPVPYDIVGEPADLYVPPELTLRALNETKFDIEITVIDSEGHPLLELDTADRTVCIASNTTIDVCDPSLFRWRSPDDGYPSPPCRNNTIFVEDPCVRTRNGKAVISNVTLIEPRSSRMVLEMRTVFSRDDWAAWSEIVVTEGDMHALALLNIGELEKRPTFLNGRALSPNPEIAIVDELGNVLNRLDRLVRVSARAYLLMDPLYSRGGGVNGTRTLVEGTTTAEEHAGDYTTFRFEAIFLRYVHGADHFVEFTSVPYLLPTSTPALRTQQCDNAQIAFKVANTSVCEPCPPTGAVCNGSEIVEVQPGFWRGNTTTEIYKCPGGPTVCLGSLAASGSECAVGYSGPLCANCAREPVEYGRSGLASCSECPEFALGVFVVTIGVVVFLTILLIWTTVTLRQGSVTDFTVIARTAVNHMQAAGKIGEFSQQWAPLLRRLFSVQDTASSPDVAGVSALDCTLRATGNDYAGVFYAYMSLPLVSCFMAVLVFAVVRWRKYKPTLSEELEAEVDQDIRSMGQSARTAILKIRYPFVMVAVTTLCVNLFALYQTLITQSTSVLACREITVADGDRRSFVRVDMTIPCENGRHKMTTAALIFAATYGFGIPAAFVMGFHFMNGRLGMPALTRTMFSFLIGGYQNKYWWWQAIIMIRKMLLVLIVVFIDDAEVQTYCGMWTMGVALIAQMAVKPNSKSRFNTVETLSLAVITVTLNLSLLYFWPQMNEGGKDAITVLLITATIGAVVMFVVFLIKPVREMIEEKLRDLREGLAIAREKVTATDTEREKRSRMLRLERSQALLTGADADSDEELLELGTIQTRGLIRKRDEEGGTLVQQPEFEEVDELAANAGVYGGGGSPLGDGVFVPSGQLPSRSHHSAAAGSPPPSIPARTGWHSTGHVPHHHAQPYDEADLTAEELDAL